MKTNIQIEISDDERLDLGQKYHNTSTKRLLTRKELNDIIQEFIDSIKESYKTIKTTTKTITSEGSWRKIYYYNGRRVTKREWEQLPEGERKFYDIEIG